MNLLLAIIFLLIFMQTINNIHRKVSHYRETGYYGYYLEPKGSQETDPFEDQDSIT